MRYKQYPLWILLHKFELSVQGNKGVALDTRFVHTCLHVFAKGVYKTAWHDNHMTRHQVVVVVAVVLCLLSLSGVIVTHSNLCRTERIMCLYLYNNIVQHAKITVLFLLSCLIFYFLPFHQLYSKVSEVN